MPKLSIITVCLNDRKGIEKTIKSVIAQKFSDYEFIVIDGNSTDGSAELIRRYGNFIRETVIEDDTGIYNAMNKGIRLATGGYLLFLNSGDYLCHPLALERFFAAGPKESLVCGDVIFESESGSRYRKSSPENPRREFFFTQSLPHPATFFRRDTFEKTGLYNEKYKISADYELTMHALLKLNLSYRRIPLPVAVFSLGGISTRGEKGDLFQSERAEILKKYFGKKYYELKRFKKVIIFFYKKLPYLADYLRSIFDKKFLNPYG